MINLICFYVGVDLQNDKFNVLLCWSGPT